MKRLTSQLKIPVFAQPDDPMSTRIDGGAVLYIHRLSKSLDAIQLNAAVQSCTLMTNEHVVRVKTTSNETFLARRVVFAVPSRLIAKHITFNPPLSESKQSAMNASHTWMAGVTKVGLVYKDRFWDEHSSNLGLTDSPAFQVYDSSTKDSRVSALTFFTLANTDDDNSLADQCASQIKNVWSYYRKPFCNQAMTYVDYHVKRWPKETYISEDANPSHIHPHSEPNLDLSSIEWNGVLLFAGSESDVSSPGVMEGAVGAALRVVQDLQEYFSSSESS
jgi:monoamine oxidase